MEPIQQQIAGHLQRIRKQRGLSLDKAAELTGVSKAMLGQIERGESNPTVTTLWKIATGLHVSFSSFLEEPTPAVTVVSRDEMEPLKDEAGGFCVYPFFPFDAKKRMEMYSVVLAPGASRESEAHAAGVEEYVLMVSGEAEIVVDQSSYHLQEGQAIRFTADRPHSYVNRKGDQKAEFHMVICYPE